MSHAANSPRETESAPPGVGLHALVLLWWDDSFGGGGWIDKEDQENRVAKCLTAGFLIGETDDHITVTCSMTEGEGGQYLGPITIPKSCITRREDLKQNKKL